MTYNKYSPYFETARGSVLKRKLFSKTRGFPPDVIFDTVWRIKHLIRYGLSGARYERMRQIEVKMRNSCKRK